jgi:hypothetical protein
VPTGTLTVEVSLPPAPEPAPPTAVIRPFTLKTGGKAATPPVDSTAPQANAPKEPNLQERLGRMTQQERCEFVYDARVTRGLTWHELSKAVGKAPSTVQVWYEKRRRQLADETSEQRRHLANARLENVIRHLMPKVQTGSYAAAETVIKAIESQRKLWGDDAPIKVASTTPDGTKWAPLAVQMLVDHLTVDELKALEKAQKLKLLPSVQDGEVVNQ